MATFTITTPTNFTALSGKTGNDTYNVNGGTFTVDCDTRYCQNSTTTTGPMGNINLSATLGGEMFIDGTNILQARISAVTVAGNVPTAGTTLMQGASTANLTTIMTTCNGGSAVASGSALAVGQWIKFRSGSAITAGSMIVGTATVTIDAPIVSWMEVVMVELANLTVNRLNKLTMNGDWWYVRDDTGTQILTDGNVNGQAFKLPCWGSGSTEYPSIEIETSPGSGQYEVWLNACYKFNSTNIGTDNRCKYIDIDSLGNVLIGQKRAGQTGSTNVGFIPSAGCAIRIPNISLQGTNSTVGYSVNSLPSVTMGTRPELITTSSGVVDIRRVTGCWYMNIQQAFSVYIRNLHTCEQFVLGEPSTAPDIDGISVGMSNQTTPYSSNAVVFQQCMTGGVAKNITCVRAEQVSTAGYACYFVNLYNGWTLTNVRSGFASQATALAGPIFFNTCEDFTATNLYLIGKRLIMSACKNWTVSNIYYADSPVTTTMTTVPTQAVELMAGCRNGVLQNVANWPGVANVHALGGLVYMNTCFDLTVTGVGSPSTPYNAGTISGQRSGYLFADGGLNKNIKFQRNWLQNLRIGLSSSTNTSQFIKLQNCYNTDATLTQGPQWQSSIVSGNRQNAGTVPTSYTHVDGMHYYDAFTGDTTARLFVNFTEASASTAGVYTINSGTPKFTSTGTCVMRTAGDQITWTFSYFILGWTGLTTTAITGLNSSTKHLVEYDLDKGSGFSGTWKTCNNANLIAETGIDPVIGFKPKIRITATVSDPTNTLTSFVINGTTTKALQDAALYPLDAIGLTISGIKPGSDVVVYESGTENVLAIGDSVASNQYTYSYLSTQTIDIGVFKSGFKPSYIRGYQLTTTPTTIPVVQEPDRVYV